MKSIYNTFLSNHDMVKFCKSFINLIKLVSTTLQGHAARPGLDKVLTYDSDTSTHINNFMHVD